MKRNVAHFQKWSRDGRVRMTSIVDHASALLCDTTVIFGDGSELKCPKASLVKAEWLTEEQVKRTIDLSHLQPGAQEDIAASFEGMVFTIEGDNLRLRMRAYARHTGEDFPGEKLPRGTMRLRIEDALQRKICFNWLMELVHNRTAYDRNTDGPVQAFGGVE